jgi:hypothetical protein
VEGDISYLTSFSIDGEHTSDTLSETVQSLSNGLRGDSNGRVLQSPHRGFSCLVIETCLQPPSIDSLVPDILLEYDGYLGEDGAEAPREIVAGVVRSRPLRSRWI